jgi:hypothetical protein
LAKFFIRQRPQIQKEKNIIESMQNLRKNKLAPRRRPIARVHGFGLFEPKMRFRKRAAEPIENGAEEGEIYDLFLF